MSNNDKIECDRCASTCRRDWLTRHYMSKKCQRITKIHEDMRLGIPVVARKAPDMEKREKKREATRLYRERLKEEHQKHLTENQKK